MAYPGYIYYYEDDILNKESPEIFSPYPVIPEPEVENYQTYLPEDIYDKDGNLDIEKYRRLLDQNKTEVPLIPERDDTVGILDNEFKKPNPLTGKPWTHQHKMIFQHDTNYDEKTDKGTPNKKDSGWGTFTMYNDIPTILDLLEKNQVMMITGGTGAGKSVMGPRVLLHYFGYKGKIAMTIPKVAAVEKAGVFSAKSLDVELGQEVGYRHGKEKNKDGPNTKLLIATDGYIRAMMTSSDPDLSQFSGIILDEIHERNISIDLLIILLKNVCKRRPEFRLIFMSATVNIDEFRNYFEKDGLSFHHFHGKGKTESGFQYELTDVYLKYPVPKITYKNQLFEQIDLLLRKTEEGHIIGFVHSLGPAYSVIEKLEQNRAHYKGNPLFLAMSGTVDQSISELVTTEAYRDLGYTRKIILGTNVLEASITVPGAVAVVETGVAYVVVYDMTKQALVADLAYIPSAGIKQRCGRTGRTCSGVCYHMYTKEQYDSFPDWPEPAISTANFNKPFLEIYTLPMNYSLDRTLSFMADMICPPPVESIEASIKLNYNLAMLNSSGDVTDLGIACSRMGSFSTELCRMVLCGYYFDCLEEVVALASIMTVSEKRGMNLFIPLPNPKTVTPEIRKLYLNKLDKFAHENSDHLTLLKIFQTYMKIYPSERDEWCIKLGFQPKGFLEMEKYYSSLKETLLDMDFPTMFQDIPAPIKPERKPRDIRELLQQRMDEAVQQLYDQLEPAGGGSKPRAKPKRTKKNPNKSNKSKSLSSLDKLKDNYHLPNKKDFSTKGINLSKLSKARKRSNLRRIKVSLSDKFTSFQSSKRYQRKFKYDSSLKMSHLIKEIKKDYRAVLAKRGTVPIEVKDLDRDPEFNKVVVASATKFNKLQHELENKPSGLTGEEVYLLPEEGDVVKGKQLQRDIIRQIKKKNNLNGQRPDRRTRKKPQANNDPDFMKFGFFAQAYKEEQRKKQQKKSKKRQRGGLKQDFKDKVIYDPKMVEKERHKFVNFLERISLRTETGVLPIFRKFDNLEDNIMACVFYGYYMNLATKFYGNKYVVKMSKIDAGINGSVCQLRRKTPDLVVYQSVSIRAGQADLAMVSPIDPKIINCFIP